MKRAAQHDVRPRKYAAPHAIRIREHILEIAGAMRPRTWQDAASLQQGSVLQRVSEKLNVFSDFELEQMVLTEWQELFRTGVFAWGLNLSNPNPPFFHFTERGLRAIDRLTRDPGNPAGYLRHIDTVATMNPIARSYLEEGLACYVAGHYKAAAVIVGAASESLVLELRDAVSQRMHALALPEPKGLSDWRIKTITDTLYNLIDSKAAQLPRELREEFQSYWLAFSQQVRTTRNDAGHPTSIDPVSEGGVHASFLVFPDLVRLSAALQAWVTGTMQ